MASQKRVFEKGNANSRQSASSQKLIWRKKLEIPDNSPPLIIRNDAGSCDFWNITGGMDQDIFHNIDTDRYAEKLKTMYVVTFRHIHSKGGIFSDVNMGLIISQLQTI